MKHARAWTFRVQAETSPGEVVGVIGSVPELGEWKVSGNSKIVLLNKDIASPDYENDVWSVTAFIPSNVDVYYRFFVCVVVENEKYIIKRREVFVIPRVVPKTALSNAGDAHKSCDKFGYYNHNYLIDRGWLTSETVIQFKLHSNPIYFWKEKLKNKKPYVKLTPVNLTKRTNSDSSQVFDVMDNNSLSLDTLDIGGNNETIQWPMTEIAVMNDTETEMKGQSQFGREYSPDDFIVFQVQVHHFENMAYLVDFYMYSSRAAETEPPSHIGFSYILPSTMTSSEGRLIVPITSTRHHPIGQLSVDYLVIQPIPDFTCDMSVSYAKYWKHNVLGLNVGHRGLGTSFKQKSCAAGVRENTIASLKEAASHGADFVEFDVQLSKDRVPVIYHDFHVCISLKRKKVSMEEMLEIPLKELTLEQLQCLKEYTPKSPDKVIRINGLDSAEGSVYHVEEGKTNKQLFFDDDLEEHQPFPTLQHALAVLDPNVGFNIEIKWTMLLKDGTFELNNPFDLNLYLDCVLKVVLEHGGSRKIVFSCFHPDICTMVKYKQTKYPVIFLTQGITSKYPMYHDPRCHTIPAAVYFALSAGILGINVHTEDILRDPTQIAFAKSRGLVVFCWGDDNNDPETIKYLKELGLHAVIYDKINEFGPKKLEDTKLYVSEVKEHQNQLLKVADNIHSPTSSPPSAWIMEPTS